MSNYLCSIIKNGAVVQRHIRLSSCIKTTVTKKLFKKIKVIPKSCIRETPNLSTDADSSTKTFFSAGVVFLYRTFFCTPLSFFAPPPPPLFVFAAAAKGLFSNKKRGGRVDQWEAGIWSCDLRANERPKKVPTRKHTDIVTTRPKRPKGWFSENWVLFLPGLCDAAMPKRLQIVLPVIK